MINIVHGNTADTTKTAETPKFELPTGVVVGKDGKLEDNRSWNQGWRVFYNSSLATLEEGYKKAEKDKSDAKKDEAYTWKTPFTFVGGIFSSVFSFIGDMFKSIFGICFEYSEKADKAENTEKKAETKETEKK